MKILIFILFTLSFITTMKNPLLIFDFKENADISNWKIVDDVVMGGNSNGNFYLNKVGNGIFEGKISLENNGGFSSLRYTFDREKIAGYKKVHIHLKGDKKRYQFRVKSNGREKHSYISYFKPTGEWETIVLDLSDMIPTFRGKRLTELPNYQAEELSEIRFLIGNKKEQNFKLEIDKIQLVE